MSGRVYERKFDWDEAKRLRKEGMPLARIGALLGVSYAAIDRVTNPVRYAQMRHSNDVYQCSGTCVDCGATISRNGTKPVARCRPCQARNLTTTVRDETLRCFRCGEWKPDDAFTLSTSRQYEHRRRRIAMCRTCDTRARQAYRLRRKVPCANGCGTLVLPPNETGSQYPTGLCRNCWQESVRRR